jgi:hypothetical protein
MGDAMEPERFLKNRSRGRQATRTLSTALSNSDPVRHLVRQRESELMREHTHLPASVGLVREHVAAFRFVFRWKIQRKCFILWQQDL